MRRQTALRCHNDSLSNRIGEHRRLSAELTRLHRQLIAAQQAALADLGPCPTDDGPANRAWWERYRRTPAWPLETAWEAVSDRWNRLTAQIMALPAATPAEAAEKLAVAYHAASGDDVWALPAVLADLRAVAAAERRSLETDA